MCARAEAPLLKDRDFLYREVLQQLPGDVWVVFGQSLTAEEAAHVQGVPSVKGVIRGDMGASGWVIAPVEGGAQSRVTYVALTDLKVRERRAPGRGGAPRTGLGQALAIRSSAAQLCLLPCQASATLLHNAGVSRYCQYAILRPGAARSPGSPTWRSQTSRCGAAQPSLARI